MHKIKLIITATLLLGLTSFKPENLPPTFISVLASGKLTFEKPSDFKEVKIIENRQMNYEYAIKHPKKNFEVRYAIRPLDELMRQYEENMKNKGPDDVYISPNNLYATLFQVTALNISGGQDPNIIEFNEEAVKNEFNADWGATTIVEVGKEFGQKYKYCMLVAIHKDNCADAYYFYLSDNKEQIGELMDPAFHSMKFQ